MDFETWDVDLTSGEAKHDCGCVIRVEGDPQNPMSVDPSNFPKNLNFIDQARLLRCGIEALAAAAREHGFQGQVGGRDDASIKVKSRTAQELERKARMFAENPGKPKRAVLSLKKRQPQPVSD
ncbi:hypothetical protein [Gilvimarinus sp. DA14]|uniref:hypothetical protein n=1 Tax=Gilvimarinus sp. DA14 TaxID=2956798 RepID=UPI0020B8374A|nr:hypothetical protein [Gilvimarinus sp. DA14]UTF61414.1 hypothetical protein NHM04_06350 [Gilvimarinus sp. DA14]